MQYNCHFYGKITSIKMLFDLDIDSSFKINSLILNKNILFNINPFISVFVFIYSYIILSIISLKSISEYKENKKQKYIINLITVTFCLFATCIFLKGIVVNYDTNIRVVNNIYAEKLTDAILDGHFYLDVPISKKIKSLKNPYDMTSRKGNYLFDTVYYKGKYYVYFGVGPSLLLFVPYKIITGKYLSVKLISFIFQILSIIFMTKFYKVIINKYFKKIPFILYIFGLAFFLGSSCIINGFGDFHIYNMISIIAFYLMIQGLYFMFRYDENNKNSSILLGSLSLSLAVACRPTMLFMSLLILPIILNKIKKKEINVKRIILFIIPYLFIGILLMIYNYIRFNNIFTFGFEYQLTVADSRKIVHNYYNILIGIYYYIFNPLNIIPQFPYLTENKLTNYFGFCYRESLRCSIFATIIPLILLMIPVIYKRLKKHNDLWPYIRNMLVIGMFLAGYECLLAGLVRRYMIDFAFLFNISSILIILFIYKSILIKNKHKLIFTKIITILIIISLTIQMLMFYY